MSEWMDNGWMIIERWMDECTGTGWKGSKTKPVRLG